MIFKLKLIDGPLDGYESKVNHVVIKNTMEFPTMKSPGTIIWERYKFVKMDDREAIFRYQKPYPVTESEKVNNVNL